MVRKQIAILLFLVCSCMGESHESPFQLMQEDVEAMNHVPLQKRQQEYTNIVSSIDLNLTSGRKSGMAAYYGYRLLAHSLGREAEYTRHVEEWFEKYANIEGHLTDLIY